jgi:hypothetical protein
LSREEIYLRAPVVGVRAPPAAEPTKIAPAEDEQFWESIQTATVSGLYEEFLSRYPRSGHAAEARQRIKDFKSKELAAVSPPAASARPEGNANGSKAGGNSGAKPADRNLFTPEDSQKVAAVGGAQHLNMPTYAISPAQDEPLNANSRFVGVWSSKRGWGNGKGRYGMLIITEVSATGLARGYYLWGPPVKGSWTQDAAGYRPFAEYIVGNKFSLKTDPEINARFDGNVLTLLTARSGKPSEKVSIELRPIWQLARTREGAEPSPVREPTLRRQAPRGEAPPKSSPPRSVSGATVEDRYRACKKLVRGFARREECARTGTI